MSIFYFYNAMIIRNCKRMLLSPNRQCFCSKKLKLVELKLKKQSERKQKLQKFSVQVENFTTKFNQYLQVAKKSPFNYLALFARSCLIANNRISSQLYYPTIKKSLNNNEYELNPFSCTALMQCFSYFKFQGDQNNVLQKLCNYYQQNCEKFTWIEETVFWQSYMKVMTQKAHTSVKFIDLKRKKRETLQFTTAEKLTQKHPLYKQMPSKFISQVQFPNPNEVSFTLHPPSPASIQRIQSLRQKKRPTLLIHVKSITNFNEFQYKDEQNSDQNVHLRRNIIQQITSVKDSLRKQWDIVIVGQLQKWEKQEKYQYTDKDEQGRDIGYVKSQRIQEFVDITDINDRQNLDKILLSNRYIKGVVYSSNNPNTRRIDTVATLLLGSLPSAKIPHFHSLSSPNPSTSSILSFTPLSTLHEAYGYSNLCNQLYNFNNQYSKIQSLINYIERNEKEQQFNLDILKQLMQDQDVTLEQAKYLLAQNSQILTDMTLYRANHVSNVMLQGKYMRGGFVGDFSWQFKPLFGDMSVIMKKAQQKLYENPDKMLKLKIISQKKYIPQIIDAILESKYWSVPAQRQSETMKSQRILEQIEKISNKNEQK